MRAVFIPRYGGRIGNSILLFLCLWPMATVWR